MVAKKVKKQKSAMAYGFFAFFLGCFGVHKFYADQPGQGFLLMGLSFLGFVISCFVVPLMVAAYEPEGAAVLFFLVGLPALIGTGVWCIIDGVRGMCNIRTPEKIFGKK